MDNNRSLKKDDRSDLGLDQARADLFQEIKALTVPIIGLLPIRSDVQYNQLHRHLGSLLQVINKPTYSKWLLNPPMIHYIFFPIEQLCQPVNLQAIPESSLSLIIQISVFLVQTSRSYDSNPLWTSKEHLLLDSMLPILIDHRKVPDAPSYNSQKSQLNLDCSDETICLAIDLVRSILMPYDSSKLTHDIFDIQNTTNEALSSLYSLSLRLIRFLFQNLIEILESLDQLFGSNAQAQPSITRAIKTISLVRLALLRLLCSSISEGSGLQLISTFMPKLTSKLTQLATDLTRHRKFSSVLGSVIQTIEWLLIQCLDEQLPDIQHLLKLHRGSSGEVGNTNHVKPDPLQQVLKITSNWKRQKGSTHPSGSNSSGVDQESNNDVGNVAFLTSDQSNTNGGLLVKRDERWLILTSTKVALVLSLLSANLTTCSHHTVRDAWVHLCSELARRCSFVLRLAPSQHLKPHPLGSSKTPQQDGLCIIIKSLITIRSDRQSSISRDYLRQVLCSVKSLNSNDGVKLLLGLIKNDLTSLCHLLIKQQVHQENRLVFSISRTISSIDAIVHVMPQGLQFNSSELYRTCLDTLDFEGLLPLIRSALGQLEFVIPKVMEFDHAGDRSLSGFFSITNQNPNYSTPENKSSDHTPSSSFPKPSIKKILDEECISLFENLFQKVFELMLRFNHHRPGHIVIEMSAIDFLDRLLSLSLSIEESRSTERGNRLSLISLWVLAESIKSLQGISKDTTSRQTFTSIKRFCQSGLRKLLESEETRRVQADNTSRVDDSDVDSQKTPKELKGIESDVENLQVTYVKGYDRLFALEKLKPVSLSPDEDKLIKQETYQTLRACQILRFISHCSSVFGDDFQPNLSWILYYVLSQFSADNAYLNKHAQLTITHLAFNCGYGSISNMINDHTDYLTFTISQQLLPNRFNIQAPFVLENLIKLIGLKNILPSVEQVLLDDCFELLDDYHGYDAICLQVFMVFETVMRLIKEDLIAEEANHPVDSNSKNTVDSEENGIIQDEVDEIFEIEQQLDASQRLLCGLLRDDPEEDLLEFQKYQKNLFKLHGLQQSRCQQSQNIPMNPHKPFQVDIPAHENQEDSEEQVEEIKISKSKSITIYQNLTTELLKKSCNFLTHSSGQLRSKVNQLITAGIFILGTSALESELLPTINKFWPIILNQLDDSVEPSLELIKTLCVHLGSYMMGKKFMNEIWPRLKSIIKKNLDKKNLKMIKLGLEVLFEILKMNNNNNDLIKDLNLKEIFVWEMISFIIKTQMIIKFKFKSELDLINMIEMIIDGILSDLKVFKSFEGSVLVGLLAFQSKIKGMEFMSDPNFDINDL